MNISITGDLAKLFKNPDFTNKENGEVITVGKWQLQFLTERDMGDGLGSQLVLEKVSIPDNLYDLYKDQVGKEVTVNVGVFSSKGKVIFYGIE